MSESFHKIFETGFSRRFSEGAAIFTGNIFLAQAVTALFSAGFRRPLVEEAVKAIHRDYCAVNESQILDLLFESEEPAVEEWKVMASKRAASLFRATLGIGAIFGEAPAIDLRTLEQAGTCIGYAFDIQDDIIGTFASEEQYGRPTSRDILLQKKPLHMVYAHQMADGSQLERLRKLLKTPTLDDEKITRIKEIIQETGALDMAKHTAREYAQQAVRLIYETSMNWKTKTSFESIIQFVVESLDWYR